MFLSDKIMTLRKKAGLTQEDLAEMLQVSRQSVSKWESGASVPDLDKIIRLSDIFQVSTDALLQEDIPLTAGEEPPSTSQDKNSPNLYPVSLELAQQFLVDILIETKKIGLGVMCFILSPAPFVFLALLAEHTEIKEWPSFIFGLTFLALLILCGLYLVISSVLKLERYKPLEKEPLDTAYGVTALAEKRLIETTPVFVRHLISGIGLFILCPVPLIAVDSLYPNHALAEGIGITLLLLAIGVGTAVIIPAASYRNALYQLLERDNYTREKKRNRLSKTFSGVYWLVIVAIFLSYSFFTENWDRSWIIWPVAGILYTALSIVISNLPPKNNGASD